MQIVPASQRDIGGVRPEQMLAAEHMQTAVLGRIERHRGDDADT